MPGAEEAPHLVSSRDPGSVLTALAETIGSQEAVLGRRSQARAGGGAREAAGRPASLARRHRDEPACRGAGSPDAPARGNRRRGFLLRRLSPPTPPRRPRRRDRPDQPHGRDCIRARGQGKGARSRNAAGLAHRSRRALGRGDRGRAPRAVGDLHGELHGGAARARSDRRRARGSRAPVRGAQRDRRRRRRRRGGGGPGSCGATRATAGDHRRRSRRDHGSRGGAEAAGGGAGGERGLRGRVPAARIRGGARGPRIT